MNFRTQKAKGLSVLSQSYLWGSYTPRFQVIQSVADMDGITYPIFARPCPTVPRHGFVDSRVVYTRNQLFKLLIEAQSVDPKAEIIVMQKISCEASAVLTPSQITLGPDNDGATQGKNTLVLPIGHLDRCKQDEKLAGVKSFPYYEILFSKDSDGIYAVQLRDGPKTAVVGNYIPKTIVVKNVLNTDKYPDLLAWEDTMRKAPKGTVVFHPGGSLVSHYAVHAVLNKIPVIFDKAPAIGITLTKNTDASHSYYDEMVQGIRDGFAIQKLNTKKYSQQDCLYLVLFATHNALALIHSKEGAHCVGMGVALAFRLGMSACVGEASYDHDWKWKNLCGPYRNYQRSFTNLNASRVALRDAFVSFSVGGLAGGTTYGGDNWAKCAGSVLRLERHLKEFGINPTPKLFSNLIGELHILVNLAHNNGTFLNKFDDEGGYNEFDTFDGFADSFPLAVLSGAMAYWKLKQTCVKPHGFSFSSMKEIKIKTRCKAVNSKNVFLVRRDDDWGYDGDDNSYTYDLAVSSHFYDGTTRRVSRKVADSLLKFKPKTVTLHETEIGRGNQRLRSGYTQRGFILTPHLIKRLPVQLQTWIKGKLKMAMNNRPARMERYIKQERVE